MTYTKLVKDENQYHAEDLVRDSEHELGMSDQLPAVYRIELESTDPLPALRDTYPSNYSVRIYACRKYSWAVPSKEVISLLAQEPVLEVGAGKGYWASRVALSGGDILATDEYPVEKSFFNVQKMTEVEAVHSLGKDRTLLLVWPPFHEDMALNALNAYREVGGKRLVYVGESRGGCTGDDGFFDALPDEYEAMDIPQWHGINDHVRIYKL